LEELKAVIKTLPTLNVNIQNINVQAGGEYIPEYEGEYFVIPKVEEQTLFTKNKKMKNNVEISAIPYAEVANLANGKTVTIG
jgi:hypothetical protein